MRRRERLAVVGLVVCGMLVARAAAGAELAVTSSSPGRLGLAPRTTTVSVTFDRAVNPSSVTSASFRVFGRASGTVSGPFSFSNGNQTVKLTPSHPFNAGETVWVNLSHDLVAADTSPMRTAGYAFQFGIASAPATMIFTEIDTISNRVMNGQTRIYGAAGTDFNNDTFPDLATVNEVSADIRVALNKGDGSGLYDPFKPRHPIGVEASPNEAADFDNDGNADMTTVATATESVWVVLGNGNGTFGSTQEIDVGAGPHGIAVLDVDGDGDLDIVNGNHGSDNLSLLLNDGSGTFGAATVFDGGVSGEYGITAGDMNADGITDLIVSGNEGNEVRTLLGNGNGTFTPAASAQDSGGATWVVVVGDVNGDFDLDAVTANSFDANAGILIGNGDGTFQVPTTVSVGAHLPSADLGDLDGDSDLDLVLSSYGAGYWRVHRNNGSGSFTQDQEITAPSNPSCAVLIDFDNDGDLDMALTDEIADVVVLEANGGVGAEPPPCPGSPAVCRLPNTPGRAALMLKDKSPDGSDRIAWRWQPGSQTDRIEFGNPLGSDGFRLCIYDNGNLYQARIFGGGSCAGKPCWKSTKFGYRFKNKTLIPDGATALSLKAGLPGKSAIAFRGKGDPLDMPAVATLAGPIDVQLFAGGSAVCWGATFSAPFQRHDAQMLRDKAD